jgi:hypothetical protein
MVTIPKYLHLVAITSTLIGSDEVDFFVADELLLLTGVLLLDSYSPNSTLIMIIIIIINIVMIIID